MNVNRSKRQVVRETQKNRKLRAELREILELGGVAHLLDQHPTEDKQNLSCHDNSKSGLLMDAQLASVDSGHNSSFNRSNNELSHSIFTASARDTFRNHSFTAQKHDLPLNPALREFTILHEDKFQQLHSDLLTIRTKRLAIEQHSTNEKVLCGILASVSGNGQLERLSFSEKRRRIMDSMASNS